MTEDNGLEAFRQQANLGIEQVSDEEMRKHRLAWAQSQIEKARAIHEKATKAEQALVKITYTNHGNETRDKYILPVHLWFGMTPFYRVPQWFVDAVDMEKMVTRSFAVNNIAQWTPVSHARLDDELKPEDFGTKE